MSERVPDEFRFEPPHAAPTPALEWVLARAFAPVAQPAVRPGAAESPFEIASRLGLAARVAARVPRARLVAELGEPAAHRFLAARGAVAALELAEDAALADFGAVAHEAKVPYALLKGKAIARADRSPACARPGSDLDLLVPERALADLHRRLERRGFARAGDDAWEHQAAVLRHAGGACLDLHRKVLGVRLDGRRSARFEALEAAGLLEPWRGASAPPGEARLPGPEPLAAHALVHALAQHGFAASYPGFWLVADLVDLGFAGEPGRGRLAGILAWIARDVRGAEALAAVDLAGALSAAPAGLRGLEGRPRQLADHFLGCAFDPRYARGLRARQFEAPLSDHPPVVARALALLRALRPPRALGGDGRPESGGRHAWRVLARPWELGRRWRSARVAAREAVGPEAAPRGPSD